MIHFRIWSDFRINDTMSWIVVTLYISKSVLCLLPHKEFDDTEEDINRNVHRNPHDISEWYITLATFFLLLPITRLYYFLGDKAMNLKEVCSLPLVPHSVRWKDNFKENLMLGIILYWLDIDSNNHKSKCTHF